MARRSTLSTATLALSSVLLASPAAAQERCRLLCAPSLKVEPTVTFSNLFHRPRVQASPDGATEKVKREHEFEVNLKWLLSHQTGGWVSSHFDVVDKFSPAERPTDESLYTHKLNLELDTALAVFSFLAEGNWLRKIELEGSLDYLATGIPKAGDEIPRGERFLDDASRWSFSLVFVIPVAPL